MTMKLRKIWPSFSERSNDCAVPVLQRANGTMRRYCEPGKPQEGSTSSPAIQFSPQKKSCRGSSFLMTAYIFLWKYRLPEMALSVQGKADKNAESSPYCTQQRGTARLPGRGIIAHRRPCCRRTHNRMYDDGHSTICRSDNHNEEGNSHSHRYISRSDGLNVPLKSS